MNLTADQFPFVWLWPGFALYFLLLTWALGGLDLNELKRRRSRQHVFYAGSIAVMMLWLMRTGIQPGLGLHLLGISGLALIAGWRLAFLGALFPLVGVVVLGHEPWQAAGMVAMVMVALPIAVTYGVWRLTERFLPSNLFVYIFVCGFFGSAMAALLAHLAAAGLMLATGATESATITRDYLVYLPLMLFPEALINGGLISVLVAYRPEWLATFNTRRYFGDFRGAS